MILLMYLSCGNGQSHLDFDVADFSGGADDGPADQRWENVLREVGACISTLDKLRENKRGEMTVRLLNVCF